MFLNFQLFLGWCSVAVPCAINEGDCDKDSECKGRLICGRKNCPANFPSGADCCKRRKRRVSRRRPSGKCCKSVRAWYAKDEKNNSWDRQESKFGYYKLQKGTVNGKAHYVSTKGNAIWYYRSKKGRGAWGVGLVRHKGTRNVSLYVRSTDDCPTEPTYDWHYLDQYKNWRDADKGFRIFCKD